MPAKVILNPYAGRWKANHLRHMAERTLHTAGANYEIELTNGPGDAFQIAQQSAQAGFDPVIVAGGDGTISEVVNGLMLSPTYGDARPRLGILPLGSANDFARNLGLPKDIPGAVKVITAGKVKTVDIGQLFYRPTNDSTDVIKSRFFANNSAIGLEPSVTLLQQQISWAHGTMRYIIAAMIGVLKGLYWNLQMEWAGGSYEGAVNLVSVGNCPITGGFYMTPHASPTDGVLTFVYGYVSSRVKMLTLLPQALKPGNGNYVESPLINEIHSPWIKIHCLQPTPVHTDGEIQAKAVQDIEWKVIPQAMQILVP